MQSSPPHSDGGKARAIRELSRSLSHSPRAIPSLSPPPSDSNPTQHSGFDTTSNFFKDEDLLHSTQHQFTETTNPLPQYPRIRSTAKKNTSWQPMRSEGPNPDTSMVNKHFNSFDHSISDEEGMSVEQARGGNRSDRATPGKSNVDSLYDITPPTARSRKSYAAETGSLRRNAQIRGASRNEGETASPRPAASRNSPALSNNQERKRTSLAQLHAKLSEDESSFMQERPPSVTMNSTKNTRWGNPRSRQTSLQIDGVVDASPRVHVTPHSRPTTAGNATAQSFILPDVPNLTELVSGIFEDGTPVFSKTAPQRSRFNARNNGGGKGQPNHVPVDSVPIPGEEKAIFAALQLLQDKVAQMESERTEAEKKIEDQELEIIELKATNQAQEKIRRSDSAMGSADSEGSGKGGWKVEKMRLDATVQTLHTKLDRAERKIAVIEIEKKRLNTERDNMAGQLGVAFQNFEELKAEKEALSAENDALREEIDSLRAENDALRDQLDREQTHHREETTQLRRQVDQTENATRRENATLHTELARVRAQHDEHTQQLARKDIEVRKARQEQAEYARLRADNETLKSQLANLKAKREEELRRWSEREAAIKAKVDRRDETIRHFQDLTQEQTNEAMRTDNEHLRQELAQLIAQHEEDNKRWKRKESDLRRKVSQREGAAQQTLDMTREILNIRQANDEQDDAAAPETSQSAHNLDALVERRPSYRRENTSNRIRSQVQREARNSRNASASQHRSHVEQTPQTSRTKTSRPSHRHSLPADTTRSVSAPITHNQNVHNARVQSDVESTTDLAPTPRSTHHKKHGVSPGRPATTTVQLPADLDLTELSFIDKEQIAQLRRTLEEERARNRAGSALTEHQPRDDTVRSERQTRDDTIRSAASMKSNGRPSLPRKSSLKDTTQKTNVTQFEEDVTGNMSNLDAEDANRTQTKQSAVDNSLMSNTSRRRRSAPTEMTSAFIVPDIKMGLGRQTTGIDITQTAARQDHDDANCTVCRRNAPETTAEPLRVPKLVPVSSRTPDDVDATIRPARSPKEALAHVVKELKDERYHLHMELCVVRAMLEAHDPSMGRRKRNEINEHMQELLRLINLKDMQIYNLYDVLEGQDEHDITEQDVEDITREIRVDDEQVEGENAKKDKKVTIQSFIASEDQHSANVEDLDDDDDLPWEGFDDTGSHNLNVPGMDAWRSDVCV